MFQCADGTCIPWSSTCSNENKLVCQDDSHVPATCGKELITTLMQNALFPQPEVDSYHPYIGS